jgi:hypothetical protein
VEVFDPASTRVTSQLSQLASTGLLLSLVGSWIEITSLKSSVFRIRGNGLFRSRYHGYVFNCFIKTQSNRAFRVTMETCSAKPHPADAQVTAFRPHVTISNAHPGYKHHEHKKHNVLTGSPLHDHNKFSNFNNFAVCHSKKTFYIL